MSDSYDPKQINDRRNEEGYSSIDSPSVEEEVNIEIPKKVDAPDVNDFNIDYDNKTVNNSEIINRNRRFISNIGSTKEDSSPSFEGGADSSTEVRYGLSSDLTNNLSQSQETKEVDTDDISKERWLYTPQYITTPATEEVLDAYNKEGSPGYVLTQYQTEDEFKKENQEEVLFRKTKEGDNKTPRNRQAIPSPSEMSDELRDAQSKDKYREGITGFRHRGYTPAEIETNSTVITGVERAETRLRNITSEMGMFLYNSLPYLVDDTAGGIASAVSTSAEAIGDNFAGNFISNVTSSSISALGSISKIKYFTPSELASLVGANFYVLQFEKASVKVKKVGGGFGNGPATRDSVWTGQPDIYFGQNRSSGSGIFNRVINAVRGFIRRRQIEGLAANQALQNVKDGGENALAPELEFTGGAANTTYISDPNELIFQESNSRTPQENRTTTTVQIRKFLRRQGSNLWNTREEVTNYSIDSIENKRGYDPRTFATSLLEEERRLSSALNRWNNYEVNTNKGSDTNYLELKQGFNPKTFAAGIKDEINATSDLISIDLSPTTKKQENKTREKIVTALKKKGTLGRKENWQLGAIYVIPIVPDQTGGLQKFYIPFEFNPTIDEGGIEARYQATQIMSRINDLQSYISTGNLTVSINANYYAVSNNGSNNPDNKGYEWMSEFSMEKIQGIEMAYRSLVMPHFPDSTDESQGAGYRYVKPPLLKVVMGSESELNDIYSGLLSYQNPDVIDGRLASASRYSHKLLRTFIATNVSIKKDLMETPLYIDRSSALDSYQLKDTFGFSVSLSLTEVTPSYTDSPPDYLKYANSYISVAGESSGVG